MRIWIALAVVLSAAPAMAQPECTVTIARAPEDVRPVVEAWVRAEPRCLVSLEVRIVATDGGLYLFARDERGRVRERVVPDAQSAGVLIASWVADDTTIDPAPRAPSDPARRPPSAAQVAPPPAPEATPPMTPTAAPVKKANHWVSFGPTIPERARTFGWRAELDLASWSAWSVGIGGSYNHGFSVTDGGGPGYSFLDVRFYKAFGYVAYTKPLGRWFLRPSLGIGFVTALGTADPSDWSESTGDISAQYVVPQGAAMIGHLIGDNWSLQGGMTVVLATPRIEADTMAPTMGDILRADERYELVLAVQRRTW